ncbi:hypothetical protein BELL_0015g00420 [Botrytis elliptica]|uniref:Uncharacterized protein n=1 Tax=Botrytis elliptica TaxID=278938 RepID=A0A4Z1K1W1_9HELO|nr:hypothetical protein BELL_0015g00420 [Botrytis elliptica]
MDRFELPLNELTANLREPCRVAACAFGLSTPRCNFESDVVSTRPHLLSESGCLELKIKRV